MRPKTNVKLFLNNKAKFFSILLYPILGAKDRLRFHNLMMVAVLYSGDTAADTALSLVTQQQGEQAAAEWILSLISFELCTSTLPLLDTFDAW